MGTLGWGAPAGSEDGRNTVLQTRRQGREGKRSSPQMTVTLWCKRKHLEAVAQEKSRFLLEPSTKEGAGSSNNRVAENWAGRREPRNTCWRQRASPGWASRRDDLIPSRLSK